LYTSDEAVLYTLALRLGELPDVRTSAFLDPLLTKRTVASTGKSMNGACVVCAGKPWELVVFGNELKIFMDLHGASLTESYNTGDLDPAPAPDTRLTANTFGAMSQRGVRVAARSLPYAFACCNTDEGLTITAV